MALIDDLKSAKNLWENGTLFTKIGIVLSTFLASGSIASLSNIVFAWKGFILDGINVYKAWVILPMQQSANHFGLHIDNSESHFLILTALFMAAIYRKVWVTSETGMRIISGSSMLMTLGFLVFLTGNSNEAQKNDVMFYIYLVICLIYPLLRKFNSLEKVAYYLPIGSGVAITLLAGAVNSGLSR
ncbi:hypothetical protein [Pseudoalteromonas sp. SR44-2]|uniref:hypothetical protein n=1 Tax=Pseudoalteromonas sp. SR44-2 TaxID=2760937 RepID=UPI00160038E8|nr:hypothetical protein [Pseudoalteromonas sp. SR44-2]MBB1339930.1 hypothetical protein [Pseudoalteromonas sp. SR44-2]